jgi:hypothetical protein
MVKLRRGRRNKPIGGSLSKVDRIKRLIPLFEQAKIILLPRTLYDGSMRDLVYDFIEQEYTAFPVSQHDDMLDALSRICDDKELGLRWPNGPNSPGGGGGRPSRPVYYNTGYMHAKRQHQRGDRGVGIRPPNEVIFASPDIDADRFNRRIAEVRHLARRITVYASKNDRALWLSSVLQGGELRAGAAPERVCDAGIDAIDTSLAKHGLIDLLGHDDFSDSAIDDVRALPLNVSMRLPFRGCSSARMVAGCNPAATHRGL